MSAIQFDADETPALPSLTRNLSHRLPEPELMDDTEQAQAYAAADFSAPHSMFVNLLRVNCPEITSGRVLDLGCGPGDITRRCAEALPVLTFEAIDGSKAMLDCAHKFTAAAGLQGRITYHHKLIQDIEPDGKVWDAIISSSLLHHLPDPALLWEVIKRFSSANTKVFVMDLYRPDSNAEAIALTERLTQGAPAVSKRDFYNSLLAAYRPEEVEAQLRNAGLTNLKVRTVSDRHMIIC